jgi:hypothetical protein
MYINIRNYIFIIALHGVSFMVFGMECEKVVLPLQKPVCQIPILYINNYIVNISSAYKGLKREILVANDVIKSIMLERTNNRSISKSRVPFSFETSASTRYIKHSCPQKYPGFLHIYVECTQDNTSYHMRYDILPYVYSTNLGEVNYIVCSEKAPQDKNWQAIIIECISEDVTLVLEELIDQNLSGEYGLEVLCPNRLSDWVIIEKNF